MVRVKPLATTKKPQKPEPEKLKEAELKEPEKPKRAKKTEEEVNALEVAKGALENLLSRLGLEAQVVAETKPPLSGEGAPVINLNVKGEDLGILIGRRGQTLAALQHLVRLIVAHQAKARVPVVVDVEGYKQRRNDALQALARKVAEEVKAKGRPFALEPMPAYERRIIHLTLANNPDVFTESTGEGKVRKVVIIPRKQR